MNRGFVHTLDRPHVRPLLLCVHCWVLTLATRAEVAFRLAMAADTSVELAALVAAQADDQNETGDGVEPIAGNEGAKEAPTS